MMDYVFIFCYTCLLLTVIPILIGRNTLKAKNRQSTIYGDAYESRVLAFILPYFKGQLRRARVKAG